MPIRVHDSAPLHTSRLNEHGFEGRRLPDPAAGFDEPRRFDAFRDAMRWGAISSADVTALQAPFRSGIAIEDYQLAPLCHGADTG